MQTRHVAAVGDIKSIWRSLGCSMVHLWPPVPRHRPAGRRPMTSPPIRYIINVTQWVNRACSNNGLFPLLSLLLVQGGSFELVQNDSLNTYLTAPPQEGEGEQGGHDDGDTRVGAVGPCYCADKYDVGFVDMLTYPRPIRKFKVRRKRKWWWWWSFRPLLSRGKLSSLV